MPYQTISKNDIYLGLDRTIAAIKAKYPDAQAVASVPFSGYMGLNVDASILSTGSLSANNSDFFDRLYGNAGKEVGSTISGFVLDSGADFLESQKQMSLSLTRDVYARTLTGISVEKAIAQAVDGGTLRYYVEKSTGVIVQTEKVFSETTHIPLGKFLAGTGHAITAYTIYDALKNPVTDAYNAVTGAGNTIDPLKSYTVAAVGILVGGAVGGIVTTTLAAPLIAGAAAGVAAYLGIVTTKTVLDSLPTIIDSAKAAGKSLAETLAMVSDFVGDKVDEAYAATGDKAKTLLDDSQKYAEDITNGLKQLADDYDWALGNPDSVLDGTLPSWVLPVVGMHGGRGMVNIGTTGCPLILDLDGNGAHSTKLGWGADRSTVYFDMDNDGFAERTGWVSKTDGLLALDKNGNGKIDGQGELFGNSGTYADGFFHHRGHRDHRDFLPLPVWERVG